MSQIYKTTTATIGPTVPTQFTTDNGTAIPAANNLNVLGGSGISTYADPNLSDNLYIKVKNSVTDTGQTVGLQTITLSTIDCSTVGTYFLTTQLSAFESSGPAGAGGQLYTSVISSGGVVAVLDDTDSIAHRSASLIDINYEIVASGTDALLQVTGVAGLTIDWGAITIYVYRG